MRPLKTIVSFVAGLFLLAGLGVIGYQGYIWYMSGEWSGIDLLSTVHWLNSTQSTQFTQSTLAGSSGSPPPLNWFYAPDNWLGLHRILVVVLDIVPLSLFLIVAGSFLFAAIDGGEKERNRIIETVEMEMRNRQAGGQ